MQNEFSEDSGPLDRVEKRGSDQPTASLSMFLDEVMALIEATIIHLEKGEHSSPAASQTFKDHRRVLKIDNDGWEAENNRKLLEHLRHTYNKRRENHGVLVDSLRLIEEESGTASLGWVVSSPALDPFGLAGQDLAMKLRGWFGALKNFLNSGSKKALEKALQWANTILGSLAAVTLETTIGTSMGIVAEPIKEMKDALHNLYA